LFTRDLQADYQGCLITVVQSRCPSHVGVTGIVLQEMTNVFKLITLANQLKIIPKAGNIFSFCAAENDVTLYGNNICFRSYDRTARRWRNFSSIVL